MSIKNIVAVPTLRMDFEKTKKIHPALFSSRNWSSLRKLPSGQLLRSNSIPRLEFDRDGKCLGVGLQPATINHAVRTFPTESEVFADASAVIGRIQKHNGTNVTFNSTTDPLGTNTAFKMQKAAGTVECGIGYRFGRVTTNNYICNSFYVKKAEGSVIQTRWWSGDIGISGAYANFDLNSGEFRSFDCEAAGMTEVGNGWWFVWAIAKVTGSGVGSGPGPDIGITVVQSVTSTRREAWNAATNAGMHLWGLQICTVETLKPGEMIITSGSAITVTGEYLYMKEVNKLLGNNEGTVILECTAPATTTTGTRIVDLITLCSLPYNTSSRIALIKNNANYFLNANGDTRLITIPNTGVGDVIKVAISYKGSQISILFNGTHYTTNGGSANNSFTRMHLGGNPAPSTETPGTATCDYLIKKVLTFDKALTEAEMRILTS